MCWTKLTGFVSFPVHVESSQCSHSYLSLPLLAVRLAL